MGLSTLSQRRATTMVPVPSGIAAMSASVPPRRASLPRDPARLIVAVATLLAFVLRLAACSGDAGLDEIWSMRLVARVDGLSGVFWGISHDNNHFLNSAWLYVLGPDAPIWAWRWPAVVLGTLTVPALAQCGWRCSAAAGGLSACFAAVALPFVDFGSEARGYAGLVLATVVAIDQAGRAAESAIAGRRDRGAAWRLGVATGLGLLCHLTMAYAVGVISFALLIRAGVHRRPVAACRDVAPILLPSALLALPAVGCVIAGVVLRGRFTIGDVDPFAAAKMLAGFGDMMLYTAGLPDAVPPVLGLAGALALLAVASRHRLAFPWTVAVGVAALVALPVGVAVLHLPNVVYARYYAVPAVALVLLLGDVLGTLWSDPRSRRAAALAVFSILAGSLVLDLQAIRQGRGSFTATVVLMGDGSAGAPVAVSDRPFMAGLLLGEAARRAGRQAPEVLSEDDLCARPAAWFIAVGVDDERPDGSVEIGPAACRTRYHLDHAFPASPLSGTDLTLYRRD